jgi:uncharacterized membrane protein
MKGFQFLCLILIGSLFALTGLRQFFVTALAEPLPNTAWFVVQVLPLLAVLPGVLRGSARGFFFAVLAAMLYFVHGVWLAVEPGLRALGLWQIAFSIVLVIAASFAMRRVPAPPDQ